jgi:hypothetical protein
MLEITVSCLYVGMHSTSISTKYVFTCLNSIFTIAASYVRIMVNLLSFLTWSCGHATGKCYYCYEIIERHCEPMITRCICLKHVVPMRPVFCLVHSSNWLGYEIMASNLV